MNKAIKFRNQINSSKTGVGMVGVVLGLTLLLGVLAGCGQDEEDGDDYPEFSGFKMDTATWNLACASLRNDSGAMSALATSKPDDAVNVGTAHETPVDLKLISWNQVAKWNHATIQQAKSKAFDHSIAFRTLDTSIEKAKEFGGFGSAGFHPDGMKFKIFFSKKVKVEFERDGTFLSTRSRSTFESGVPKGFQPCPEIAQVDAWSFPGGTFGMRFGPTTDSLVRFVWIEEGHRH